jgi:hypothetical protein
MIVHSGEMSLARIDQLLTRGGRLDVSHPVLVVQQNMDQESVRTVGVPVVVVAVQAEINSATVV